jgi:hypothetical protein
MNEWARRRERALATRAAKQAAVQDRLAALRDAGQLELFRRPVVPPPLASRRPPTAPPGLRADAVMRPCALPRRPPGQEDRLDPLRLAVNDYVDCRHPGFYWFEHFRLIQAKGEVVEVAPEALEVLLALAGRTPP